MFIVCILSWYLFYFYIGTVDTAHIRSGHPKDSSVHRRVNSCATWRNLTICVTVRYG